MAHADDVKADEKSRRKHAYTDTGYKQGRTHFIYNSDHLIT